MAFTTDWGTSLPIDHTKIKNVPQAIRNVRVDLEDRLASIIYGFTSGEAYVGFKRCMYLSQGTAAPSAPTGTGDAASYDVYGRRNGTATEVELYGQDAAGNEIQFTKGGKFPLNLSARLDNNGWLISRNAADDGDVNILKVNTGDQIEFASHPRAPDTGPSVSTEYAPKGYVDAQKAIVSGAVNNRTSPLAAETVSGTDDQTAPVSESDMSDMSITVTTYGTKALIVFAAPFYTTGQGGEAMAYINVDGSNKTTHNIWIHSNIDNVLFMHLETGLTPGSHTFKVRWVSVGSQWIQQRGSSDAPRYLTVLDLD